MKDIHIWYIHLCDIYLYIIECISSVFHWNIYIHIYISHISHIFDRSGGVVCLLSSPLLITTSFPLFISTLSIRNNPRRIQIRCYAATALRWQHSTVYPSIRIEFRRMSGWNRRSPSELCVCVCMCVCVGCPSVQSDLYT